MAPYWLQLLSSRIAGRIASIGDAFLRQNRREKVIIGERIIKLVLLREEINREFQKIVNIVNKRYYAGGDENDFKKGAK